MKLKRKYNKGFTLVELIVVIAIVAILAAVSVVSYLAFINSANESADIQLVKQLNTILQADEILNDTRENVNLTLQVVENNGYIVERLTPTTSGCNIVYDRETNRFALIRGDDKNATKVYADPQKGYNWSPNVWKILNKNDNALSEDFSNYLSKDFVLPQAMLTSTLEIKTGLDVGEHFEALNVSYIGGAVAEGQDSIIRMQGGTLCINNANDTVIHYGFNTVVNVIDVKKNTYHEHGKVGRLFYSDSNGSIYFENTAYVYCYMNTSTDSTMSLSPSIKSDKATVYSWSDKNDTEAHGAASGDAVSSGVIPVCTHVGTYEVVVLGDYRYVLCTRCGAFALYDLNAEDPTVCEAKSEGLDGDNPFNYNPSPVDDTYGFYNTYVLDGIYYHEIKDRKQFRNIGVFHYYALDHANEIPLNAYNENAIYVIKNDIDFGNVSPWSTFLDGDEGDAKGYYYLDHNKSKTIADFVFTGTLDGNGYKLYNCTVSVSPGNKVGGDAKGDLPGLFDAIENATFRNFRVANFVLNCNENSNDTGKPAGIIACGYYSSTPTTLNFSNITIADSCAINSCQAGAPFVGYARGANCEFTNCVNNASLTSRYANCGGFIGSATGSGGRTFRFTNCVNNGTITNIGTENGKISGFIGSHTSNASVYFDGCTNTGDIIATKSDYLGFFYGQYGYGGETVEHTHYINCYNSGYIKTTNPSDIKDSATHIEFSDTVGGNITLIKYDPALGYTESSTKTDFENIFVVPMNLESFTFEFDQNNHNQITVNSGSIDYDSVNVNISLGAVDKFTKENSSWANSSGSTSVTSQNFNNVSEITVRELKYCGWVAPTSSTVTGTYENRSRTTEEVNRYHDYRVNDNLKGTEGYTTGYYLIDEGSYYILDNDPNDASPNFSQIFKLWLTAKYSITLFKNGTPVGSASYITHLNADGTGTEILPYIGCYGYTA